MARLLLFELTRNLLLCTINSLLAKKCHNMKSDIPRSNYEQPCQCSNRKMRKVTDRQRVGQPASAPAVACLSPAESRRVLPWPGLAWSKLRSAQFCCSLCMHIRLCNQCHRYF